MKTGIIMEINERFLTLLTPEGEFLRAANQNRQYQIGQEIDFFPITDEETHKRTLFSMLATFKAKAILAAALMIVLVSSSIFTLNENNEVYAYMSIDFNPSMELAVNDRFQVIEILPFNKEGEEIVKHIRDWKKKNIQVITSQIIEEAAKHGYTKGDYEVVIGTVKTKQENKALETKWEEKITEIKESIQKEKLEVKVMDASPIDREQAKEKGLSIGSYKETQLKKQTENHSVPNKDNKHNKHENKKLEQTPKSNQLEKNEGSRIPPGQLKKGQDSIQNKESNNINKIQSEKAKKPPGQEKKEAQEKVNNGKTEKKVNENKNQQKWEDKNHKKENQSKSNGPEQNKGKANSKQKNEKEKGKKDHQKD